MKVKNLVEYLNKHCNPEWDVVVMHPDSPDRSVAYAERSGKERMALLVLNDGVDRQSEHPCIWSCKAGCKSASQGVDDPHCINHTDSTK